jgi:uncharacterized membrane protein YagU involved in acid resistance
MSGAAIGLHLNLVSISLAGFIATVVLTTTMAASQALGFTRMSLPFLIGTAMTPNRDRAMLLGTIAHLINGWLLAVLYALVFEDLHRTGWWLGAAIGLVHALFVLVVVMPLFPSIHPRMVSEYFGPKPNRALQPPGFLALHYGRATPVVTLVGHLVYGSLIGLLYQLAPR